MSSVPKELTREQRIILNQWKVLIRTGLQGPAEQSRPDQFPVQLYEFLCNEMYFTNKGDRVKFWSYWLRKDQNTRLFLQVFDQTVPWPKLDYADIWNTASNIRGPWYWDGVVQDDARVPYHERNQVLVDAMCSEYQENKDVVEFSIGMTIMQRDIRRAGELLAPYGMVVAFMDDDGLGSKELKQHKQS